MPTQKWPVNDAAGEEDALSYDRTTYRGSQGGCWVATTTNGRTTTGWYGTITHGKRLAKRLRLFWAAKKYF